MKKKAPSQKAYIGKNRIKKGRNQKMPKYLVRRINRYGQWVHIDTLESPPSRESIEEKWGPGEYNIMIAEEGIRGLQSYTTYAIPYTIEYVGWTPEKPDVKYLSKKFGVGNYFVIGQSADIEPVIVVSKTTDKTDEMVEDFMMQGVNVMRKVYVIFRLKGIPYQESL